MLKLLTAHYVILISKLMRWWDMFWDLKKKIYYQSMDTRDDEVKIFGKLTQYVQTVKQQ